MRAFRAHIQKTPDRIDQIADPVVLARRFFRVEQETTGKRADASCAGRGSFEKEAQHFTARIGATRVGIGASRAPT